MMPIDQSRVDRLSRTLKRLGFQLGRTGRSFRIFDSEGNLADGSKGAMSVTEVENWIANYIKPRKAPSP
jgi:hypothetical protein